MCGRVRLGSGADNSQILSAAIGVENSVTVFALVLLCSVLAWIVIGQKGHGGRQLSLCF